MSDDDDDDDYNRFSVSSAVYTLLFPFSFCSLVHFPQNKCQLTGVGKLGKNSL